MKRVQSNVTTLSVSPPNNTEIGRPQQWQRAQRIRPDVHHLHAEEPNRWSGQCAARVPGARHQRPTRGAEQKRRNMRQCGRPGRHRV